MPEFLDLIEKIKKKKQEIATAGKRGTKSIYDVIGTMKIAKRKLNEINEEEKEQKIKTINIRGNMKNMTGMGNISTINHPTDQRNTIFDNNYSNYNNLGNYNNMRELYSSSSGFNQDTKYSKTNAINIGNIISSIKSEIQRKGPLIIDSDTEKKDIKIVNETYPVKSKYIHSFSSITAFCNIKFNLVKNSLFYNVIEPPVSINDAKEINKIKKYFEETINIHYEGARTSTAIDFVKNTLKKCIKKYGLTLSKEKLDLYNYYLFRDLIGLGKIDPLLNDSEIEDISCDGVGIPVFVFHRNPQYGSLETNIIFRTKTELDNFVMKLAQRCGKTVSIANPYFDGALPDGTRVQATLSTDIATRGSNFTLRKFKKDPITPSFLLKYKSTDVHVLAYLWFLIEHNTSILVVGGTASGKTSLLNALCLFIPQGQKIISIEDTPEIQLSHPNWVAEVSRQGFETVAGQQKKMGEVSMYDLLKEALRQRPDYIIVGEVRGEEAIILFQAMATGHSGLATIHADSMERLIDRITSKPLDIPPALLETLDVVIFIKRLKYKNVFVRRISEIYEIQGYNRTKKEIISRKVFEWNSKNDSIDTKQESILLGNAYTKKGIAKEIIIEEFKKRAKVLNYMKEKNITQYRDVSKIIKKYYVDSNALIEQIDSIEN